MQCQKIKMQEKRPSLNQHQTWMPSGFDCNVFKFVKITQLVLEKGPVGSKVLERNVCVSNSEIKAEKEQPDHEVRHN